MKLQQAGTMGYKAVLFDFDYTLADASPGILASYHAGCDAAGLEYPEDVRILATVGLPLEDMIDRIHEGRLAAEEKKTMIAAFHETGPKVMVESTSLLADTREVLAALKKAGYALGIVSNKRRETVCKCLMRFDMQDIFDVVIGPFDGFGHKPDPEGLVHAIQELGVEKRTALYVGDTEMDAETAENAGVDFASVATGFAEETVFLRHPRAIRAENLTDLMAQLP
jgi:phosphoglycolate phosphatase